MKENLVYWIRVLILAGVLLFILLSCTVWAQPVSNASIAPATTMAGDAHTVSDRDEQTPNRP